MDPSRAFIKHARRVVIKVGTAVVTRHDGRLALGRLGALCEQVKELMSDGIEVIFVTSGAVGVGRQKLRHQRMMNSSFVDLQKPQMELDGKACAAVGQSGLMALYDSLFSQLDVASSQLLVTDNDFQDPAFRQQLSETVNNLIQLRVVPIFNENDAISTRKAPYKFDEEKEELRSLFEAGMNQESVLKFIEHMENLKHECIKEETLKFSERDSTGIFWDNDSLSALLALELKADLLILLSDVEGLYTGPPSDPKSQLIHTYLKEKHDEEVTFGEKSRVGRGGMTAKVYAAWQAASAGIPVVISSGCAVDGLQRVMRGDHIGTLFHKDAHLWVDLKETGAREMAVAARDGSRRLQGLTSEERKSILHAVADALLANEAKIKAENEADVELAQQNGISKALIGRLTIKAGKIAGLASSLRTLADMKEPVGEVLKRTEIAEDLILEKTSCPLGVVLVVFESRPDALVQIASLAIRSGNGLLLKGGKEAARSNAILHKVITEALPKSVGPNLIGLVTSRDEIPDLLKLDDVIDLVIPRGSNQLVAQIKASTKIPVLGHADGVCHVFVDKAADLEKAKRIVVDSKVDYPAACNALETLLVHEELVATGGLEMLTFALQSAGVTLYGGERAAGLLKLPRAASYHTEYSALSCTVEVVKDVQAAINHIHEHGSAHTDCIVTEDHSTAETFLQHVDSAAVFHNASTRFSDGARFGLGAEVGISTGRIHARGPVGVEGLLTTRWLLRGNGQLVNGDRGVRYTHQNLPIENNEALKVLATANQSLANGNSTVVSGFTKAAPSSNGSS